MEAHPARWRQGQHSSLIGIGEAIKETGPTILFVMGLPLTEIGGGFAATMMAPARNGAFFGVQILGDPAKIMPMAGDLGTSKPSEINEYVLAAKAVGKSRLHFYAWGPNVTKAVWSGVAAAAADDVPVAQAAE